MKAKSFYSPVDGGKQKIEFTFTDDELRNAAMTTEGMVLLQTQRANPTNMMLMLKVLIMLASLDEGYENERH